MSSAKIIVFSSFIFLSFSIFCINAHYQDIMQKLNKDEKDEKVVKKVEERREYLVDFKVDRNSVKLSGLLPRNRQINEIIFIIQKKFTFRDVEINLSYINYENIKEEMWYKEIIPIVTVLNSNELDEYNLKINQHFILLSGKVDSQLIKYQVEKELKAVSHLQIFNKLSIKSQKEISLEMQRKIDDILKKNIIEFDKNSFALLDKSEGILDMIVLNLKKIPNEKIRIEGFVTKDENFDENLSQKRADCIREYFIKHGLNKDRILAVGKGENSKAKVEIYVM